MQRKLTSKVLVIHCRDHDIKNTDASNMCLAAMMNELGEITKECKIHRHCFNGGLKEMRKWQAAFPKVKFGVTAVLLCREFHPELEQVVNQLPIESLLLETDSPHLLAPEHIRSHYNSPYGIEAVAERVAQLKGLSLEKVLFQTLENTKALYNVVRK